MSRQTEFVIHQVVIFQTVWIAIKLILTLQIQ